MIKNLEDRIELEKGWFYDKCTKSYLYYRKRMSSPEKGRTLEFVKYVMTSIFVFNKLDIPEIIIEDYKERFKQ